jgi:hypothetical protein
MRKENTYFHCSISPQNGRKKEAIDGREREREK